MKMPFFIAPKIRSKKDGDLFPPGSSDRGRRSGFTLVELITVIVIIGVLAIILIPVMGAVRKRSKSVQCMANIRQSAMLLLMRATENGNRLAYQARGSKAAPETRWTIQLAQYLIPGWTYAKDYHKRTPALDILFCPGYAPYRHDPDVVWDWGGYGAYSENTDGARTETIDRYQLYVVSLGAIQTPAHHPLLMDSVYASIKRQYMTMQPSASDIKGCIHLRHGGKAHIAFLDGHVEAMDAAALKDLGFVSGYDETLKPVSF